MADMYLYILCEGELDEMFYERVCERITGKSFESPQDFRLRHGSNWKTAIAGAKLLLSRVKSWSAKQEIGVIIAVDNDRTSGHPCHKDSAPLPAGYISKHEPRYPSLGKIVSDTLGDERDSWPVKVALAVPVEMIESWVLTLINPSREYTLPPFAKADQPSANRFYGSTPPPQLKDLCEAEAKDLNVSLADYFWKASEQDLNAAAATAPSFALFLKELQTWK